MSKQILERVLKRYEPKPRDLRFVSFAEADRLIRDEGFRLAPEEDRNREIGMVYVEKEIA